MNDIEELSAEESAAIEEMQADSEPVEAQEAEAVEPEAKEAATEAAEEPEEAEFKSSRKDAPPDGYVPHQAMHKERVRRQELEAQNQELAQRLQAFNAMLQQQQAEAQKPPEWADSLTHPEEAKRYQEWQAQQVQATQQRLEQMARAQQMQQVQQARYQDAVQLANSFREQVPDYDQAVEFINKARHDELAIYGLTDDQIKAQMAQEANGVYDAGKRLGMNPAEIIYNLAKQRGYRGQQVEEAQRIEALADAQRQTQGLGSGGARASGRLTLSQIAEMSEADVAKLGEAEIARAFGG